MVDHQKHLRAEKWTSIWEEQVYIPPEERQQPKSWEQTNKRRGKEKINKLNDKGLYHHSPVNLGSKEALMQCFTGLIYTHLLLLRQSTRGSTFNVN